MKNFLVILSLIGLLCACNSTQQGTAVKTLASVHQTADAAYKGYLSAVLSGSAKTNDVPKISQDYRDFQVAFTLAVAAVNGNTNAVVPQQVFDSMSKLTSEITQAKGK